MHLGSSLNVSLMPITISGRACVHISHWLHQIAAFTAYGTARSSPLAIGWYTVILICWEHNTHLGETVSAGSWTAFDVSDIHGELRHVNEVSDLPGSVLVHPGIHGESQWFHSPKAAALFLQVAVAFYIPILLHGRDVGAYIVHKQLFFWCVEVDLRWFQY